MLIQNIIRIMIVIRIVENYKLIQLLKLPVAINFSFFGGLKEKVK